MRIFFIVNLLCCILKSIISKNVGKWNWGKQKISCIFKENFSLHRKRKIGHTAVHPILWVLNSVSQDATLVVDDTSGADQSASTAGKTLVGEDKGTVFRNLNRSGRANLFAQTAANAAHLTIVLAAGILVGAKHSDGVILQAQVDDALRAG